MDTTSASVIGVNEAQTIKLGGWSVFLFLMLFGIGWGILGRNIPPYSPSLTAAEISAVFRDHAGPMRIGLALGAFSTTFLMTWAVALFRLLIHIERGGKILSYLQLMGGSLTAMVPLFACITWLTAAFRPEQDPNVVRMLYDLGWLIMDIGFGITIVQYVALGIIAIRDQRDVIIFPKWLGWLGIWIGTEFAVELVMPSFRAGPFAWDGLFAYWIPFFVPFAWMVMVAVCMIRGTDRLATPAVPPFERLGPEITRDQNA